MESEEQLDQAEHVFKVGDVVVELGTDGPPMTVTSLGMSGIAFVQWFEGAKLRSDSYNASELVLAEERAT